MSLAGLRDISVIETPPEGRRPVKTYVGEYDEELVRRAIEREVARKGQAFFLHNRVETIDETAERVRAMCPKARVMVAHGQMEEKKLEEVMLGFLRGEADVLVCTTIIESGLDISSANTLIVERADELGLAQLYQIRGRVGRSKERAYAYLLYPSAAALTEEAGARLATLSDYTELGSGFKIAMRDLEIRGAGNLLGDDQSGHVAAVGFELYVSMLDDAVAALAGDAADEAPEPVRVDLPVNAYVPGDYVPYEAAKIEIHRRVAGAKEIADLIMLARSSRTASGRCPSRSTTSSASGRPHQARTRRGAQRRLRRRAPVGCADRARLAPGQAPAGAPPGGGLRVRALHREGARSRGARASDSPRWSPLPRRSSRRSPPPIRNNLRLLEAASLLSAVAADHATAPAAPRVAP